MNTKNPLNIRPISEASQTHGNRIIAYVDAAESANGWMEMHYSEPDKRWRSVISHPYTNASLTPIFFMDVPQLPELQA